MPKSSVMALLALVLCATAINKAVAATAHDRAANAALLSDDLIDYAGLTRDPPWPDNAPGVRSIPMPYDIDEERHATDDMDHAARHCMRHARQMTRHERSECFLGAYKLFVTDVKLRDMKAFDRLVAAERVHDTAKVTLDSNGEPKSDHFDELYGDFYGTLFKQFDQSQASVRPYDPSAAPRAEAARNQAIAQCPPAKPGVFGVRPGIFGARYQCMLLADRAYARQVKDALDLYRLLALDTSDAAELADQNEITAAEMERRYQTSLKNYHDELARDMNNYQCWKISHDPDKCWRLSHPRPAAPAHP